MDLDQEVCLCFHVSRRKLESFIRHERPCRASQLAECYGAGTGCKWCVRYLKAIFHAATESSQGMQESEERDDAEACPSKVMPSAEQYAAMRTQYRQDKKAQAQQDSGSKSERADAAELDPDPSDPNKRPLK